MRCNYCMLQGIRRLDNVEVVDVVPKPWPEFPDGVEVFVTYKAFPNDRIQVCWFVKLPKECACSNT